MNYLKKICFLQYFYLSLLILCTPTIAQAETTTLPLDELKAFSTAYHQIKSNYVKPVSDDILIKAAIRGMVESLDKHSRYLVEEQFKAFMDANNGEYAGVGVKTIHHKLGEKIVDVVKDSPAAVAGIKTDMIITKIDGTSVKGLKRKKINQMLKGEVDSQIKLSVKTSENGTLNHYQLKRELVMIASISNQLLPNNVGYIAISQFTFKSFEEFNVAINKMSAKRPLKKLIIDLRNNPGGTLDIAINLSNLFINDGKLLISRGNTKDANKIYYATEDAPLNNLDVVVVINSGSASASEILAAALRDHKKATILGENSYGKGSIQSIFPLEDRTGIKLTSAEYFSPLGSKIQDVGIKPDITFKTPKKKNPYKVSLLDDVQLLQAYYLLSK